ncbi:hypothetical protein RA280_10145 [Cupriavidus sp. CV2]|uniref:hypothetical protein n=1 Tax=Cupriavidus ulmosensis TaxID=3065913 RepID=UPI00296AE4F4|nr:hypothetical protein [Cupriavidus sp. CV2]MDW3682107.1 hypothetical protein [Cupriavidus sp. CV2]
MNDEFKLKERAHQWIRGIKQCYVARPLAAAQAELAAAAGRHQYPVGRKSNHERARIHALCFRKAGSQESKEQSWEKSAQSPHTSSSR